MQHFSQTAANNILKYFDNKKTSTKILIEVFVKDWDEGEFSLRDLNNPKTQHLDLITAYGTAIFETVAELDPDIHSGLQSIIKTVKHDSIGLSKAEKYKIMENELRTEVASIK